ncbi:MAG TPA: saccharopine dehydrogenase NADP-binding domain-containing protein, partial [Candidatus Binatia bacterium]|nr:saccharopine dehydrogenase NADP-binding domain-containing protein [Candidatus Binatia bacterium]
GLEGRVARLADTAALDAALRDVRVVLHAAGPYYETAAPMVAACLRAGAHYLDITGEIPVIEALAARHAEARRRGVMLMPAVGFDVVPTDCLAAHLAARLPSARRLVLAIQGLRFATRASAKTAFHHAFDGVRVRRDGRVVIVPWGRFRRAFDWGDGPRESFAATWGDVGTAWYTTGIPDITVYFEATAPLRMLDLAAQTMSWLFRTAPGQAWLEAHADVLPDGPEPAERDAAGMVVLGEVEDAHGRRAVARLRTPEAYAMTGLTGPAIAARVLGGDLEPGFQTPGRVYGADFVLGFPGVVREDLDDADAITHAT